MAKIIATSKRTTGATKAAPENGVPEAKRAAFAARLWGMGQLTDSGKDRTRAGVFSSSGGR